MILHGVPPPPRMRLTSRAVVSRRAVPSRTAHTFERSAEPAGAPLLRRAFALTVAPRDMAILSRRGTEQRFELKADTLIGRSRHCDLILGHDSASQTHASIRFIGGAWHVEDRNSKNGTWVDGECLSKEALRRLAGGCVLRFGAKGFEEWELSDESPPASQPLGLTTVPIGRHLDQADLWVHSNLNVVLSAGGTRLTLKARVPYVLLRVLAEERLRDRSAGLAPEEEGWLDRRLLLERLHHRDVNQDIHRIRQDFQRLELFDDANRIVEDHREQSKVRLGVYRVHVD